MADLLHAQGDTFLEQHPWLSAQQRSVLRAIARCRTAALGGHLDRCDACGHQAISYNSCRNRHCPKCQAQARERWLHAYDRNELDLAGATEPLRDPAQWHAFVDALFDTDWVVYAKPAFGGASAVLHYLGRYTHRVAIANRRLLAFDGDRVSFQWKDYARENRPSTMTLSVMEFLRRFVQHILPRGFVRIRQSGFLANTCRATRVALARTLLGTPATEVASTDVPKTLTTDPLPHASWACPRCGATMILGPIVSTLHLATLTLGFDTS